MPCGFLKRGRMQITGIKANPLYLLMVPWYTEVESNAWRTHPV